MTPAPRPTDRCQRCGILDLAPERPQDIRMTTGARPLCAECREDLGIEPDVTQLLADQHRPL